MQNTLDVNTGQIKICHKNKSLICRALGSCISVILADPVQNITGMAHIMLPGSPPPLHDDKYDNRYAENAIRNLISELRNLGAVHLEACILGGANVLMRPDDEICSSNIHSVTEILSRNKIDIKAKSLGGFERRSVLYQHKTHEVTYSIGNSSMKKLYNFNSNNIK